jgi:geranylgeranyl pyrophosphate synthase
VLAGLSANGRFAARWKQGPIEHNEVQEVARFLASEGGYETATDAAQQMMDLALMSLREAGPQGDAGEALFELSDRLLKRNQ